MHRNSALTSHDAAIPVGAPAGERLEALESIRGFAALSVVVWHLAMAFFPYALAPHDDHHPFIAALTQTPLRVAFDGEFAVRIFFVLSGVVLSLAFFQRPSHEALSSATIRRYFRLAPPIVLSVLIGYALMELGWYFNHPVGKMLGNSGRWLQMWYVFPAGFGDALREGLTCLTRFGYRANHTYNPVLWTMPIEMYGSLLVFATLALAGRLRRRFLIYMVLAAVFCFTGRIFINFVVGIALCDLFVADRRRARPLTFDAVSGTILILLGLGIASLGADWFQGGAAQLVHALHYDLKALGATMVIGVVLFCPFWRRMLERPTLTALGRYSFSLYLLHFPILCSLGCYSFLLARTLGNSITAAGLIASGLVLASTLLASRFCYTWIDRPSIAFAKRIDRFFQPIPPGATLPQSNIEPAKTEASPLAAPANAST